VVTEKCEEKVGGGKGNVRDGRFAARLTLFANREGTLHIEYRTYGEYAKTFSL